MDELEMLRELLVKPGPSAEVVERGRRRLDGAIRGPVRRREIARRWSSAGVGLPGRTWLAGAVSVSAAAAAAAVLFASGAGAPVASARQLLLAAARTAAAAPEGSGAYWHLKQVEDGPGSQGTTTQETWTRRDGSSWILDPAGRGVWPWQGPAGFSVGVVQLSFAQLQQLPTDPAGLKAWVAEALKPVTATIPAEAAPGEIAVALSSLLYDVPAPAAVRAAAFRALAALPDVTSLGAVGGGQGLLITGPAPPADKFPAGRVPAGAGEIKLVIDPATSTVRSVTNYQGTETILVSQWTDRIPPVAKVPSKRTAAVKSTSRKSG
jgi:hypothetical protein